MLSQAVAGIVSTIVLGYLIRRARVVFFRRPTIAQVQSAHDLKRLKDLTSILVVDDDANAFPVELLQAEGYRVSYWKQVQNLSLIESGAFDVVVLDISGVAKQWSDADADGLAILRMIKKSNPTQYVISFSGQKSVHELGDFWKLSDGQLKKPVAAEDCKAAIDDAIRNRVNVGHYWSRIGSILRDNGVSEKSIKTLESQLVSQCRAHDPSEGRVRDLLKKIATNEKVQDLVVTLSTKLIGASV